MTFDLTQILASKRALRQTLAACDISEKLRMLDALRERTLALSAHRSAAPQNSILQEDSSPYPAERKANPS